MILPYLLNLLLCLTEKVMDGLEPPRLVRNPIIHRCDFCDVLFRCRGPHPMDENSCRCDFQQFGQLIINEVQLRRKLIFWCSSYCQEYQLALSDTDEELPEAQDYLLDVTRIEETSIYFT